MLTNAYTIRRASRAYTLCFQQRSLLKGLNTTAPVLGRAQRPDGGSRPMLPSQSGSAGWTEPRGLSAIPWHFAHWNASPRRLLRDLRKRGVSKNLLFIYLLIRFVSENFLNRKPGVFLRWEFLHVPLAHMLPYEKDAWGTRNTKPPSALLLAQFCLGKPKQLLRTENAISRLSSWYIFRQSFQQLNNKSFLQPGTSNPLEHLKDYEILIHPLNSFQEISLWNPRTERRKFVTWINHNVKEQCKDTITYFGK